MRSANERLNQDCFRECVVIWSCMQSVIRRMGSGSRGAATRAAAKLCASRVQMKGKCGGRHGCVCKVRACKWSYGVEGQSVGRSFSDTRIMLSTRASHSVTEYWSAPTAPPALVSLNAANSVPLGVAARRGRVACAGWPAEGVAVHLTPSYSSTDGCVALASRQATASLESVWATSWQLLRSEEVGSASPTVVKLVEPALGRGGDRECSHVGNPHV